MSMTIRLDVRPLLGPVRDQGARPTCLAHASTTAHEYARGSTLALSPEYLHYFASRKASSSEGVNFSSVCRALMEPGQPTETDCPYRPNEQPDSWTPPTGVTLYRRQSTAPRHSQEEVEALLEAGYTPVLGIATTDAFYAPAPPWVLSAMGPVRGLHAVLAVGVGTTYTTRHVLIRNSWGTAWADAGHAWLADDFIIQHLRQMLVLTDEVA